MTTTTRTALGALTAIPATGLRIWENDKIEECAPYADLAPMWKDAPAGFRWALYRWDGSIGFFVDDAEALTHFARHYSEYVATARVEG